MPYIGREPAIGNYVKLDDISSSFNGALTTFNLTADGVAYTPGSPRQMIVSVGGTLQEPDSAFTISGSQITFTEAPTSGSDFWAIVLGDVLDLGVPSDDTVSTIKIQNGGVTTAKIADGAVTSPKLATGAVGANTKLAAGVVTNHAIAANTIQISKLATTGTANSTTYLTGAGAFAAAGGGFKSMQVFTASGTWTKPAGINTVKVTVVGGGGGGGFGSDAGVGGAGGGGTAIKVIDVSAISSETVTVGAGGAAGASAGSTGSNGGTSSFGAHCSATGGSGSVGPSNGTAVASPGTGGSGSSGDVNITGGTGDYGWRDGGSGGSANAAAGKGGDSTHGFGGPGGLLDVSNDQAGVYPSAIGYGGGGAGKHDRSSTNDGKGGDGTGGIVIVEEYE